MALRDTLFIDAYPNADHSIAVAYSDAVPAATQSLALFCICCCCCLQAGWKLLGDALLQQADVAGAALPCTARATSLGAAEGVAATTAAAARAEVVGGARRAYAAALHLDPTQGKQP
jgi:hypothetical protein